MRTPQVVGPSYPGPPRVGSQVVLLVVIVGRDPCQFSNSPLLRQRFLCRAPVTEGPRADDRTSDHGGQHPRSSTADGAPDRCDWLGPTARPTLRRRYPSDSSRLQRPLNGPGGDSARPLPDGLVTGRARVLGLGEVQQGQDHPDVDGRKLGSAAIEWGSMAQPASAFVLCSRRDSCCTHDAGRLERRIRWFEVSWPGPPPAG